MQGTFMRDWAFAGWALFPAVFVKKTVLMKTYVRIIMFYKKCIIIH